MDKMLQNLENAYDVKASTYLSEGYELFKQRPGELIGYLFVTMGIGFVVQLFGLIPLLGLLILMAYALIVQPSLTAGYFYFFRKQANEGTAEFGDFFKSFQWMSPLAVAYLLIIIVMFAVIIIPTLLFVFFTAGSASLFSGAEAFSSALVGSALLFLLFFGLVMMVLLALLSMSFIFVSQLVMFRNMQAADALKTSWNLVWKNMGGWLVFAVLIFLINFAGALACFIGLLVSVPVTYGAIHAAYRDVIGDSEEDNIQTAIEDLGTDAPKTNDDPNYNIEETY
jgi:uncharacterized membrane protein